MTAGSAPRGPIAPLRRWRFRKSRAPELARGSGIGVQTIRAIEQGKHPNLAFFAVARWAREDERCTSPRASCTSRSVPYKAAHRWHGLGAQADLRPDRLTAPAHSPQDPALVSDQGAADEPARGVSTSSLHDQ